MRPVLRGGSGRARRPSVERTPDPTADLAAFAEEMKRIGAHWQLTAYPGVVHAFTNPKANDPSFGTVYDADADRMSWVEMSRFFAEVMA